MAAVPESKPVDDGDQTTVKTPPPVSWPNRREDYELMDVIGSGATAVVQVALCTSRQEKVAIKRIDLEQYKSSMSELQKEINLMSNCNHPNVINYFTSFVVKHELWLIMKLMSGGSLLDIIKFVTSKGNKGGVLDEVVIATILREALQGLEYFHSNSQIHRDLKAGNILIGEDGSIQLADFGVSNWLYGEAGGNKKRNPRFTFVGTPCWMAPEVMDQSVGYDSKADIWSFGITALELATGSAPYAKFPPMKVLMLTMENPPPTLDTCCEINGEDYRKNYSKSFQKMVEKCLQKDPAKRPSATDLLKHPFFKKAKGKDFIKEVVLGNTPSLASRATKVKRVPGTSGHLHRTEEGGWVWSDEEISEEYDIEDPPTITANNKPAVAKKDGPSSSSLSIPTTTTTTSPSPALSSSSSSSLPDNVTTLQSQMLQLSLKVKDLQEEITKIRDLEQKMMTEQIRNPTLLTTPSHQAKAVELLSQRQEKERDQQQLNFQQQQIAVQLQQMQTHTTDNTSKETEPNKSIKIALRKRTEQNQLKDIKFDFLPGTDTADAIAQDLLTAGLLEGKELVVVAANIRKLVDNPSQKFTFQVGSVPQEQLDDKKLIGYALLYVVQPEQPK